MSSEQVAMNSEQVCDQAQDIEISQFDNACIAMIMKELQEIKIQLRQFENRPKASLNKQEARAFVYRNDILIRIVKPLRKLADHTDKIVFIPVILGNIITRAEERKVVDEQVLKNYEQLIETKKYKTYSKKIRAYCVDLAQNISSMCAINYESVGCYKEICSINDNVYYNNINIIKSALSLASETLREQIPEIKNMMETMMIKIVDMTDVQSFMFDKRDFKIIKECETDTITLLPEILFDLENIKQVAHKMYNDVAIDVAIDFDNTQ